MYSYLVLIFWGLRGSKTITIFFSATASKITKLLDSCNEGTITNFDPLSFTHSVVYDDADEDLELKMWREIIISM